LRTIGDGTQLLMPVPVDAHSHGRGLSPIQKGVRNDFLENALFDWAYMPILPPELTAAIGALHRAELHSKIDTRPDIDIGGKAALPRCKRRRVLSLRPPMET